MCYSLNSELEVHYYSHFLLSLKLNAVLKLYFARKENEEQLRQFLKAAIKLSDVNLETVDIIITLTKQHVSIIYRSPASPLRLG